MLPESPSPGQQRVLDAIADFWRLRGYGPSYREIGDALGIRSKNGVSDHVKALVKRGLLVREVGVARSVRLAKEARQ